jgi:hypothetical protein
MNDDLATSIMDLKQNLRVNNNNMTNLAKKTEDDIDSMYDQPIINEKLPVYLHPGTSQGPTQPHFNDRPVNVNTHSVNVQPTKYINNLIPSEQLVILPHALQEQNKYMSNVVYNKHIANKPYFNFILNSVKLPIFIIICFIILAHPKVKQLMETNIININGENTILITRGLIMGILVYLLKNKLT